MKKEEIGGKEKEEDDDYNREDKEKKISPLCARIPAIFSILGKG